jgi:prolipoprotein diacylglyceryltransferase
MDIYLPFGWFYLINILTGGIFLIIYGYRKKFPAGTWITSVAFLITLFITGLRLTGVSMHEWADMAGPAGTGATLTKFVPGGVLFFVFGWMVLKWFLKFRSPMTDSLIMIIPWLIIIQRTGCFINGCCYGSPSHLPWAVTYPAGTSAYEHYLSTGDIHAGDVASCGLHPAQLYTIAGALLIWFILLKTRHLWKRPGSRSLFGLLLLGAMRFTVEFFRATPDRWYAVTLAGINFLQWIILALIVVFSLVLVIREQRVIPIRDETRPQDNIFKTMGLQLMMILILWNLRHIFDIQEIILVQVLITAAIATTIVQIYRPVKISGLEMGVSLILLIAFTTMSQDLVRTGNDTIRKAPVKTWFTFTAGGSDGRYENRVRDCEGNITARERINLSSGGMDLSYHYKPNEKNQLDFGLRGWISEYSNLTNPQDKGFVTYGFAPYANYSHSLVGLGVGLNIFRDFYEPKMVLFPSLYLRIGKRM